MSKRIVQDIVPGGKRSIRNIPVDRSFDVPVKILQKKEIPTLKEKKNNIPSVSEIRNTVKPSIKKKNSKRMNMFVTFIVVFVCIVIIGGALSLLYSKAVVTITPKIMNLQVDGKFTAKKDAESTDLKYELTTSVDEMHKAVAATDGPLIQTKAKGTIVLYNNLSSTAQKIIAGTRLTNSSGLVYRTATSVSIPGNKTVNAKLVPGSVSVSIIADQAGEKYNMKLVDLSGDFKVIAYKGTDKYNTIYGRLKSDMTGGFQGSKKIVSPEVQKQTTQELQDLLKTKLIAKLKSSVPDGYVLYDDSFIIENKILDIGTKEVNTADIGVKTTVSGVMFSLTNLLNYVAGNEIKKFPSKTYNVKGMATLDFKIMNAKDFSATKATPITFSLKGPLTIIGMFSEKALKDELKGISLKASNEIFSKYPAIGSAYALLTPFWIRSFPNSVDKITIEYKSE